MVELYTVLSRWRVRWRVGISSFVGGLAFGCMLAFVILPHRTTLDVSDSWTVIGHSETLPGESSLDEQSRGSQGENTDQHVRVACLIPTTPANVKSKAIHVKATWGKRCDVLAFFSSEEDDHLPAIKTGVVESREQLWNKTKFMFKYAHEHFQQRADWFLKADDDTYVVLENLRHLLSGFRTTDPVYLGRRIKNFAVTEQGYMSGGSGYVLSKEALRMMIEEGIDNYNVCHEDGGAEDVEMGQCMENLGVEAGDSRDEHGEETFFPFLPEHHLNIHQVGDPDFWFISMSWYPHKKGLSCCSSKAVSFHYVTRPMMYTLEYLIYHLHPHGYHYKWSPQKQDVMSELLANLPPKRQRRRRRRKNSTANSPS
ncbi:PREDICTED: glycoprotein-N-acetylgalactosamine 3-beta-galactosyltransferase 1-like [Priapulus caudatus]|uniref:N-acetylgalactosaminide beta-1,3-galactosyltransferase n=1 Tax=Priapulus caudatus TaxID=37621 RepID=A0ABM1DVI6_PRICU|nr:PREDICTED: glycoprotein-N-acetylgalactosamine 3-beta-galactosyltransferase 1-like [Priapulus caudatus]